MKKLVEFKENAFKIIENSIHRRKVGWNPAFKCEVEAAKYDTAHYYSRKALDLADKYFQESNKEEMFEKADVLLTLADINEKEGQYDEELTNCKKALELAVITDNTDSLRLAKWQE